MRSGGIIMVDSARDKLVSQIRNTDPDSYRDRFRWILKDFFYVQQLIKMGFFCFAKIF